MNYLNQFGRPFFLSTVIVMFLAFFSCEEELNPFLECEEIEFTSSYNEEKDVYSFVMNNIDVSDILWLIDNDTLTNGSTDSLAIVLDPGSYEICVLAFSEACDDVLEYCKELIVDNDKNDSDEQDKDEDEGEDKDGCHELAVDFSYNQDTEEYEFYLGNGDATHIEWTTNGIVSNEIDSVFSTLLEPGINEICVNAKFEDCEEELTYCKTIEIESSEDEDEESSCPDLSFTYQNDNDIYYFTAAFDGIDTLEWYGWFVDGAYLDTEDEGTINEGDNQLMFIFNELGTHEVCIMTETPDCPNGIEFCKEIVVE